MADDPGGGGAAASPDEVWAAVDALSQGELTRLEGVGQRLAYGIRSFDGKDVLMEAIERALRGSSVWSRGVSLPVFLFGVMRNVAKQWRELKSSSAPVVHVAGHGQENEREVHLKSPDPSPEDALLDREAAKEAEAFARQSVRQIDELFKDDVEIEAVLYGIRCDMSASQVQEDFGITATQYASARRRMRRTLAKEFPGRVKS